MCSEVLNTCPPSSLLRMLGMLEGHAGYYDGREREMVQHAHTYTHKELFTQLFLERRENIVLERIKENEGHKG